MFNKYLVQAENKPVERENRGEYNLFLVAKLGSWGPVLGNFRLACLVRVVKAVRGGLGGQIEGRFQLPEWSEWPVLSLLSG